jgi:hypothetical protein
VPFARLSDERNEEADLYVPEDEPAEPYLLGRAPIELPIDENLMPSFYALPATSALPHHPDHGEEQPAPDPAAHRRERGR